jgi:hypothetical protein
MTGRLPLQDGLGLEKFEGDVHQAPLRSIIPIRGQVEHPPWIKRTKDIIHTFETRCRIVGIVRVDHLPALNCGEKKRPPRPIELGACA